MKIRISDHAQKRIEARNLSIDEVIHTVKAPEQIIHQNNTRAIYQRVFSSDRGQYLLRVVVEYNMINREHVIVTAYRTSQISRYWRNET